MKIAASNPAEQRRQLMLLGLLVLVALVVWYTMSPDEAATEAPASTSNPAVTPKPVPPAGGRGGQTGNGLPEPVRLADLEPVPEQSAASRNPFGFGSRPAPPPPPPQPQAAPSPQPPPPPPRPTVQPLPPIPVKFLGFGEDPARPGKVVSLRINGEVVLAREGDVVEGRYRLVKVGDESIVMSYADGRGQQTIRLSGS